MQLHGIFVVEFVVMMDILAGVDGLIKRGIVDEDKQVVTGGSYGGFMTNWLLGHTDRFKAGVTQPKYIRWEWAWRTLANCSPQGKP